MTEPGVPAPAETVADDTVADETVADDAMADDDAADDARARTADSPGARRTHPLTRPTAPMALVSLAVVGVDQLTKWIAQRELADGRSVHVVGSLLELTLTYNSGMAFSRGRGLGPVIGVVALVIVVVLLASMRRESSRLGRVALAAVIGGAIGNLLDRTFRAGDGFLGGSVVDFLQLPHWPVFNVADMAVTLGGLTLVLGAWRAGRTRRPAQ